MAQPRIRQSHEMTERNWAAVNERAAELGCASWRELLRRIATGEIIVANVKPMAASDADRLFRLQVSNTLPDRSRAAPIAGGGIKS